VRLCQLGVCAALVGGLWIFLGSAMNAPLSSLFLSVTSVLAGPQWLAWRVCYPLGLRRVGRAFLFVAPGDYPGRRERRLRLFDVAFGKPLEPAPPTVDDQSKLVPLDGWTACAAVLEAERRGQSAEASGLTQGLLAVPLAKLLPHAVRRQGIELVSEAAASRRDWPELARRASLGRGRSAPLFRLLARAHLVRDVPPALLWCAWVLAPARVSRRHAVQEALAAQKRPPGEAPRRPAAPRGRPHRAHLDLLQRAARGEETTLASVLAVARTWSPALSPAEEASFRARGLVLGSRQSAESFRDLRENVLEDLTAIARGARGDWPSRRPRGLAAELRDRLYDETLTAVEKISRTRCEPDAVNLQYPLEEWRLWLRFRTATEAVHRRFGDDALRAVWYNGARLAAWNWPCRLLEMHGDNAAWACHVMFRWTVEVAERCEDEEAATVNRRNAGTARQRIAAA
jgi:hypothetical protein